MNINQEVSKPTMPDEIYLKQPIGKRGDGFTPNKGIPIERLSKEQAEEYAELMKVTFLKHWENSLPQGM